MDFFQYRKTLSEGKLSTKEVNDRVKKWKALKSKPQDDATKKELEKLWWEISNEKEWEDSKDKSGPGNADVKKLENLCKSASSVFRRGVPPDDMLAEQMPLVYKKAKIKSWKDLEFVNNLGISSSVREMNKLRKKQGAVMDTLNKCKLNGEGGAEFLACLGSAYLNRNLNSTPF